MTAGKRKFDKRNRLIEWFLLFVDKRLQAVRCSHYSWLARNGKTTIKQTKGARAGSGWAKVIHRVRACVCCCGMARNRNVGYDVKKKRNNLTNFSGSNGVRYRGGGTEGIACASAVCAIRDVRKPHRCTAAPATAAVPNSAPSVCWRARLGAYNTGASAIERHFMFGRERSYFDRFLSRHNQQFFKKLQRFFFDFFYSFLLTKSSKLQNGN